MRNRTKTKKKTIAELTDVELEKHLTRQKNTLLFDAVVSAFFAGIGFLAGDLIVVYQMPIMLPYIAIGGVMAIYFLGLRRLTLNLIKKLEEEKARRLKKKTAKQGSE